MNCTILPRNSLRIFGLVKLLFPEAGQDIEFLEDATTRLGRKSLADLMKLTWSSRLSKPKVRGIHGPLFIGLQNRKADYPNKRETDLDSPGIRTGIRGG